ncbi:MAG: hypothetical protein Q9190_001222 [Brigantiaea leucoxantha]
MAAYQSASESLAITVEFTGGLESLFSNQRKHHLNLPLTDESGQKISMDFLVRYLCENVMKHPRSDFFMIDEAIRPGILVLINEADWELEGEGKYELQKDDNILFVSTLHGG